MASQEQGTIKTRILVLSDTHGADFQQRDGQRWPPSPPFAEPLPKADVAIHCGDLTMVGKLSEYEHTLDMLRGIDAPVKLVIAGNHDRSLDRDFTTTHVVDYEHLGHAIAVTDKARHLWTGDTGRAKGEGITFLDEGYHHVKLPNGAAMSIYASPYTPEFCDWAFPYEHNQDRFNTPLASLADAQNIATRPVPSFESATPIDVMITHGPPFGRLDETMRGESVGCPHLLRAVMRARPLMHCFGHIHEGYGAEIVDWSSKADAMSIRSCNIQDWKIRTWQRGVSNNGRAIELIRPDLDVAPENHGNFLDCTQSGQHALRCGKQTLMVNASIMTLTYKPLNAPWIIDLELPGA